MSGMVNSLGRGQSHDLCLALEKQGMNPALASYIIDFPELARAHVALAANPDVFELARFRVEVTRDFNWNDICRMSHAEIAWAKIEGDPSGNLKKLFTEERAETGVYDAIFLLIAGGAERGRSSLYGRTYKEQRALARALFPEERLVVPNAPTAAILINTLQERKAFIPREVAFRTSSHTRLPRTDTTTIPWETRQEERYTLLRLHPPRSGVYVYSYPDEGRESVTLAIALKLE